jgi:hypothetical protein
VEPNRRVGDCFFWNAAWVLDAAMRDPDGPVRRWLDRLSTPARVTMTIEVIAVTVAVIVWG